MVLTGLKSRWQQCFAPGALSLPAARGCPLSLAQGPFLLLQSQQHSTLKSLSNSDSPSAGSPNSRHIWVIQDNLFFSRPLTESHLQSAFHHIHRFWGLGWTSMRGHYSACHTVGSCYYPKSEEAWKRMGSGKWGKARGRSKMGPRVVVVINTRPQSYPTLQSGFEIFWLKVEATHHTYKLDLRSPGWRESSWRERHLVEWQE